MGYRGKSALGLAIMVGGLVVFVVSIVKLVNIGTCASGGPYVSARQCPAGTGYYIVAIFPAVIAFLVGAGVFATRGGGKVKPGLPPQSDPTLANPMPFGQAGTEPGAARAAAPAANVFTQGFALRDEAINRAMGGTAAPAPGAVDPLSRLERLGELRKAGVLTEEEFATEKARILKDV